MVTPKMVSEKFARKWYGIGNQYANTGLNIKQAIVAAYDDGKGEVNCWESAAAFRAGLNNIPFEIKEWKRYGTLPVGDDGFAARSVNHADGEPEYGVSVADKEWENSLRGKISQCSKRKSVSFFGIQVGFGSDDEPVVLPINI
jgi:hypothetical protein